MNTSVKQKKELWPKFEEACRNQWIGGGDRYALTEDKEFTDLICEALGVGTCPNCQHRLSESGNKWIGGNIIKYVGEILNTEPMPEVNFFKIATWAFIWWIKEREHLTQRDKGEEIGKETKSGSTITENTQGQTCPS